MQLIIEVELSQSMRTQAIYNFYRINAWFQVCIFEIFLGRAHPAPPQTSISAQSLAAPSIWVSPSIHPFNMIINPSPQQKGTRSNTVP